MIKDLSQESIRKLTDPWFTPPRPGYVFNIHSDTSEFYNIQYGDIVILNDVPYLIRHNAKEGRFGLDDEEKYWVKRAIDLNTGDPKIIKLVFFEKFIARVGGIDFECFRSPRKEARILGIVKNHDNFMHGFSVQDEKSNVVRVIDFIYGKTLSDYIRVMSCGLDHETYFYKHFPEILDNFIECAKAILFLHENKEKHGDIRRDHILIDREAGCWRWIDFDYNFRHRENMFGYDLFGLGNVLMYLVGMGDILIADLFKQNHPVFCSLCEGDMNIVFNNRVANIKKIYPYIPDRLNHVLMHFSRSANVFYDNAFQFIDDLNEFRDDFLSRR